MSNSDYTKIFTGNSIVVQKIVLLLKENNIQVIVKDESESARLAGFGAAIDGLQDVYVKNKFAEKATEITSQNLAQ